MSSCSRFLILRRFKPRCSERAVFLLPGVWRIPQLDSENIHRLIESSVNWIGMEVPHSWQFKEIETGTYTIIALASKSWTPEGLRDARRTAVVVDVTDEPISVLLEF